MRAVGATIVPSTAMAADPPNVTARHLLDMAKTVGLAIAARNDAHPVATDFTECARSVLTRI